MLYSYNSYLKILESKQSEKKIEKVIAKIKKFVNIPEIYNWAIDKCTNNRKTTEGLKYAIWVANQIKNYVVDDLIKTVKVRNKVNVNKQEVELYLKGENKELSKKNK